MRINILKLGLSALMTFCFLLACAGKNNEQQNDVILTAYRLIDENRSDEAIELLENSLKKECCNYDYKIVLSSAYAHKAGFKIQKLAPTIGISDKIKEMNDKFSKISENKSPSANESDKAENVAALLAQFSIFYDVYKAIPTVDKNQSIYLSHAIAIFDDLDIKIKPEDALYKTILEVILFKHLLTESLVGDTSKIESKNTRQCRLDSEHINKSILKLGNLLLRIYSDISLAQPKQSEYFNKLSAQASALISQASTTSNSATILSEANISILKQTAIQYGFGKIVTCDSE